MGMPRNPLFLFRKKSQLGRQRVKIAKKGDQYNLRKVYSYPRIGDKIRYSGSR